MKIFRRIASSVVCCLLIAGCSNSLEKYDSEDQFVPNHFGSLNYVTFKIGAIKAIKVDSDLQPVIYGGGDYKSADGKMQKMKWALTSSNGIWDVGHVGTTQTSASEPVALTEEEFDDGIRACVGSGGGRKIVTACVQAVVNATIADCQDSRLPDDCKAACWYAPSNCHAEP